MVESKPIISRQSSVTPHRRPGVVPLRSQCFDWPLSKDEKRRCVMNLYERDVQSANGLLKEKDKSIKKMDKEIKVLRHRVSLGSASTRSSLDGNESSPVQGHDNSPLLDGKLDDSEDAADVASNSTPPHDSMLKADESAQSAVPEVHANVGEDASEDVASIQLSAREIRLRTALLNFYREHQINTSVKQATRLAQMCGSTAASADSAPELWAAIASKYGMPPVVAVSWLVRTLGPLTPVQWAKEQVPKDADAVLDRITLEAASSSNAAHDSHCQEVRLALRDNNLDMLSALTFRGCPEVLRAEVWRSLLCWRRKQLPLQECRQVYRKSKIKASRLKEHFSSDSGVESNPFLAAAPREIEADMKQSWQGDTFLGRPGVKDAVSAIAWATAVRYGRYVRGTCEMAALLLFVMAGGTSDGSNVVDDFVNMDDAEADAFWCLDQLMKEMQGSIVDNVRQTKQAEHIHFLLRLYDAPLAELLFDAGIVALPATRLGVALCSRAGFTLAGCIQLWDALLADPKRFEFCNYAIVAVLLLNRERLFKQCHDSAALAEEVLAAPRRADIKIALATAYSICAFERRCNETSQMPFPPRPRVLDAVRDHVSNLADKVRAGGAGVWRAGRNVARRVVASAAAAQATGAPRTREDEGHHSSSAMTAVLEAGII